jgi:hypothetical protein
MEGERGIADPSQVHETFKVIAKPLPANFVLGDLVAQSIPTNAENAGGFSLVASSLLQSACDDTSLVVVQRWRIRGCRRISFKLMQSVEDLIESASLLLDLRDDCCDSFFAAAHARSLARLLSGGTLAGPATGLRINAKARRSKRPDNHRRFRLLYGLPTLPVGAG